MLTGMTPMASDYVSFPQVLETRSNALDGFMPAFEILKTGWVLLRARGEVFVVAIGSSSCGNTSEGGFGKKVGFGNEKGSHWDCP